MSCKNLLQIDVHRRLLLLDVARTSAMISSHAAASFRLQLDGYVASIRFGDGGEPKLQPGAPRRALHLRHFAQDLFQMRDHAIGFL